MVSRPKADDREILAHLCLLNHSASKLGLALSAVFDGIEWHGDSETREFVQSFLGRPEATKALEAFGYREVTRASGFDYKREW